MTENSPGEFFARNSQLFTVMGVFGAISVYFTQLDVESRWRRLGIVSSLTIFLLVAISIQKNVSPPSSDKTPFDFIIKRFHQRRGLTIFYVAFYAVVISVAAIVIQFSDTLLFLLQFLFLIAGFKVVTWSIGRIGSDDVTFVLGQDSEVVVLFAYILRNGIYGLVIGGGTLVLAWMLGWVSIEQTTVFQVSSYLSALVVGFASGLALAGLLYVVTMLMALFGHYMFRRFEGHEVLDWYEEVADSPLFGGDEAEEDT